VLTIYSRKNLVEQSSYPLAIRVRFDLGWREEKKRQDGLGGGHRSEGKRRRIIKLISRSDSRREVWYKRRMEGSRELKLD